MQHEDKRPGLNRRSFLKRASAITLGSVAARGVYEVLDQVAAPQRAEATVVRRMQEQYLIRQLEVIVDNGQTVVIPPIFNDVFTAKLKSQRRGRRPPSRTRRRRWRTRSPRSRRRTPTRRPA